MDALLNDLPELHATGAGLKALCCVLAADGIEDLRRSCGGHGFLMSSGIAPLEQDYKGPNTTAEGDYVLLSLQTARYLMKSLDAARKGEPLAGLTAGLAALSEPNFSPLNNGRASLGLPDSAASAEEMSSPTFLEKLFQWRSLVCITRVGAALDKARAEGLSETEAWNANARLLYTTACKSLLPVFPPACLPPLPPCEPRPRRDRMPTCLSVAIQRQLSLALSPALCLQLGHSGRRLGVHIERLRASDEPRSARLTAAEGLFTRLGLAEESSCRLRPANIDASCLNSESSRVNSKSSCTKSDGMPRR